jgi:hypothetical protein
VDFQHEAIKFESILPQRSVWQPTHSTCSSKRLGQRGKFRMAMDILITSRMLVGACIFPLCPGDNTVMRLTRHGRSRAGVCAPFRWRYVWRSLLYLPSPIIYLQVLLAELTTVLTLFVPRPRGWVSECESSDGSANSATGHRVNRRSATGSVDWTIMIGPFLANGLIFLRCSHRTWPPSAAREA